MGEVSAKVFLGSGVEAKARAAVREIVVEGVRSKQVAVVIKGEENAEIALAGPNPDEGQLQALAESVDVGWAPIECEDAESMFQKLNV